jgi:hypothetical protein
MVVVELFCVRPAASAEHRVLVGAGVAGEADIVYVDSLVALDVLDNVQALCTLLL